MPNQQGRRRYKGLTDRQAEACALMMQGYNNRAIARLLSISLNRAEALVSEVYTVEGTENPDMHKRVALVLRALSHD